MNKDPFITSFFTHDNKYKQLGSVQVKTRWSIEVYPPKSQEKNERLITLLQDYQRYGVTHVNITGKIGDNKTTVLCTKHIKEAISSLIVIPHIVLYSLSLYDLKKIVKDYSDLGITNMFVVRGDIPYEKCVAKSGGRDFLYASDVVKQIKDMAPDICIGVAGYPSGHYEQPNFLEDIKNLKKKINAGADYIITQMFFSNHEYFDFVKRCKLFDINVPIIPGITCVKNVAHSERLADLAMGSIIPADLLSGISKVSKKSSYKDIEESQIGERWFFQQVKELQKENTCIHFYVFNSKFPFIDIILKLS